MYTPLSAPRMGSGAIRSSWTSAPRSFDWRASSRNDLSIIAPQPIPNYPRGGSVVDAAVALGTSRAHATDDEEMAPILGGCFEDCEPLSPDTMSLLPGTDFAIGHGPDETYREEWLPVSGSDLRQQLLTTSTWQEADTTLSYTYQHPVQAHPPA